MSKVMSLVVSWWSIPAHVCLDLACRQLAHQLSKEARHKGKEFRYTIEPSRHKMKEIRHKKIKTQKLKENK